MALFGLCGLPWAPLCFLGLPWAFWDILDCPWLSWARLASPGVPWGLLGPPGISPDHQTATHAARGEATSLAPLARSAYPRGGGRASSLTSPSLWLGFVWRSGVCPRPTVSAASVERQALTVGRGHTPERHTKPSQSDGEVKLERPHRRMALATPPTSGVVGRA